jgi:hypothetical protein
MLWKNSIIAICMYKPPYAVAVYWSTLSKAIGKNEKK